MGVADVAEDAVVAGHDAVHVFAVEGEHFAVLFDGDREVCPQAGEAVFLGDGEGGFREGVAEFAEAFAVEIAGAEPAFGLHGAGVGEALGPGVDVAIVFDDLFHDDGGAGGLGDVGITLFDHAEGGVVNVFEHADVRDVAPLVEGVEDGFIGGEEDDAVEEFFGVGEELDVGFDDDAEGAF